MPTSASSDVIPVKKTTKQALASVKGDYSYDELLRVLLSVVPPDQLRMALEKRQEQFNQQAEARRELRQRTSLDRRSPEKQILIARLADTRWKQWLDQGRVVARGPRLFDWRTDLARKKAGIRVEWEPRRGMAASEGARNGR